MERLPERLKRGLLIFWAAWFSVVLASNVTDALQQLGWFPAEWPFVSGNFALVYEALGVYVASRVAAGLLFSGVLVLQALTAWLFWRAAFDPALSAQRALLAHAVGIALFAAFLISDELLVVYHRVPGLEPTHFRILVALLVSLAVVRGLPERAGSGNEGA